MMIVVVPCFNEAVRLDIKQVHHLIGDAGCNVLLVDDGSTDATPALLADLAANDPRISVLTLMQNVGKAEAVRQGLLDAIAQGADHVGYLDADFATSPHDFHRLVQICIDEDRSVVIGSRVALLGHHVERTLLRHCFGRVYATLASQVLGLPVYDTQCGAKVFAVTTALRSALATPFVGRWSFDVELLGRLARAGAADFLEVPLESWADVGGSKLKLRDSVRATFELVLVRGALRRYALR